MWSTAEYNTTKPPAIQVNTRRLKKLLSKLKSRVKVSVEPPATVKVSVVEQNLTKNQPPLEYRPVV